MQMEDSVNERKTNNNGGEREIEREREKQVALFIYDMALVVECLSYLLSKVSVSKRQS